MIHYDELNRVTSVLNPLGDTPFTWDYNGPGGRLSAIHYPNGMATALSYGTAAHDRQLSLLTHWKPGQAEKYSELAYHWDAAGRLLQWGQSHDGGASGLVTQQSAYG